MELLATVHWVAKYEQANSAESAVRQVHAWSERKKMFSAEHNYNRKLPELGRGDAARCVDSGSRQYSGQSAHVQKLLS
jgi:hypothetical protein